MAWPGQTNSIHSNQHLWSEHGGGGGGGGGGEGVGHIYPSHRSKNKVTMPGSNSFPFPKHIPGHCRNVGRANQIAESVIVMS